MIDGTYQQTRKSGKECVVTRLTGNPGFDPKTGVATETDSNTTVRWVTKEPTKYSRIMQAEVTQHDIGDTTFIIYTKDVTFGRLDPDDYITWPTGGTRYEVVSCDVEGTAMLVTAREVQVGDA